jgi:putative DNA primase/helicase
MSIASERRFSHSRPCPVCSGHPNLRRGNSERCYGFLAEDGQWAHCTREEYAGRLEQNPESGTYAHKLVGDCRCGARHDPGPADANGHASRRKRKIVETYPYRSAEGNSVYQGVRFDPKGFAQRRPDGRGGYIWNLDGVERVLYRLPELLAANLDETVYVPEGEKDVDLLAKQDLVATTNPQGAGKWRDEYTAALKGRHVAILQDNDEEGRKHAEKVARALYGGVASVKVVVLPGLPEKGDVSDWLNAGNSVDDLLRIVDETPQWEPPPSTDDTPDQFDDVGTLLSDVVEESVEWLWEGRIPLGKLTVIDGDPGTWKSALTIDLAARVSTRRQMPMSKEVISDE